MSHPVNTNILEGAWELFDECLESHDFAGARIIIEQLHRDGFTDEAYDLENQLLEQPLSKFVVSLNVQHL